MTAAAIAIPLSTVPAASAPQTAEAGTSGEGFAAALAALLGVGASATPNHAAPVHAHGAKPQATRTAATQDNQTDLAATATPPAGTIVPAQAPTPTATPAPAVVATAAGQVAAAQAALVKGAKDQTPGAAATATTAAAQATAASASDAAAPAQTQNAALIAQQLAGTPTNPPAPNTTPAPAPATTLKAAQKAATAKQAPAPAAPATDAQNQAAAAKPEATQQVAPAGQRSLSDGNAGTPSDLPAAKIEAAAPQAQSQPFVVNMQAASDAQAAAPSGVAQAAVPLDALAVHIARKFESGESRFEIRLDPAGLGKLDISMTVDHDGRVQAVLRAERPETLDMLQRDARVLENQLRQTGLNVDSNSLNFSLGGGNGNRQTFGDASTPFGRALDFAPEIETAKPATTIVSVRDGVDIRI